MYQKYLELLKERGVTTSAFCEAMDVSESAMSMWKRRYEEWNGQGKRPTPSLDTVAKMSKFFGVPIEYFLGE